MTTETAKLLLEIDASVELLRQNLSRAEQRVQQFGAKASTSLDGFERKLGDVGVGALGVDQAINKTRLSTNRFAASLTGGAIATGLAMLGTQLISVAGRAAEYAQSLRMTARELGVTTDTLQQYRFAASQVSVAQQDIDQGLGALTAKLRDAAAGAAEPSAAFAALGVSIRDSEGNIRDAGDVLPELADALRDVEDPARRSALQLAVLGPNASKLGPLLSQGAQGINRLTDAANELGATLSQDEIARADEVARKLDEVKRVLEAQIASAVAANADAIIDLANALAEVVRWAGEAARAYAAFRQTAAGRVVDRVARTAVNPIGAGVGFAGRLVNAVVGGGNDATEPSPDNPAFASPARTGGAGGRGRGGGGRGRGGGRNGPDPEEVARRLARDEAQYADDIGQLRNAILASAAQLTGAASARYAADMARIAEDRASWERRIAIDDSLTDVRRNELRALRDVADGNERAAVEQDLYIAEQNRALELLRDDIAVQMDRAETERDMADSAQQRLAAQNRLIDLAQEQERATLNNILATEQTSSAQYELAERALARLDAERETARRAAARDIRTPGQTFLAEVNRSSDAIAEDLEAITVNGLNGLNEGLADAILNAGRLEDVFSRMADQIINDLLRIAIQQAIIRPLTNSLFAGSNSGGSFSNLLGAAASAISGSKTLTKRAGGGPVTAGEIYLTGEAGRELFVPKVDGDILTAAATARLGGGGSGGTTINFTVNAPGATAETVAMIRRELSNAAPQIVEAARQSTMRTAARPRLPG